MGIWEPPAMQDFTFGQTLSGVIWMMYSMHESRAYFSETRSCQSLQPGSFEYILDCNLGNLNNVFFFGVLIDAVLSYFVKSKIARATVVLVLALTVSWMIEHNDPADMIGSVVGFLLYAVYNFTTPDLYSTSQ